MEPLPVGADLRQVRRIHPVRGPVPFDRLCRDVNPEFGGGELIGGRELRLRRAGPEDVPRGEPQQDRREAQQERHLALVLLAGLLGLGLDLFRVLDLLLNNALDQVGGGLGLCEPAGAFGHFLRNLAIDARKSAVARLAALTSADSLMPASNDTPSSW